MLHFSVKPTDLVRYSLRYKEYTEINKNKCLT